MLYNGGMKKLRSNLDVLIAQHNQKAPRSERVSKRSLAEDLNISRYTIYALANNELDQYPRDVIETLCNFFNCDVGELLTMRDVGETAAVLGAAQARSQAGGLDV